MEESIGKLCKTVALFCNNLQTSCLALKDSVYRRPIPLDSASTTFVQSLNQSVSSLSSELNMVESMSCETVSFEELLGHCNQLFKDNQTHLLSLHDRLQNLDYISSDSGPEEENANVWEDSSPDCSLDFKKIEDDPLLDDSLNLQNLGLSDVCLATIASEAITVNEKEAAYLSTEDSSDGLINSELKSSGDIQSLITVSVNDYENLPKHIKNLASRQELVIAVEKINSFLHTKRTRPYYFQQDEIAELGQGHKARSYLLLLIRMNQVIVEKGDGLICYRIP